MWYELILLTTGMTGLFCPISQYERGFMLNNKIDFGYFLGFWSFAWMTLGQCKQQKGLSEDTFSLSQNQAPGAAQAAPPVLFPSLALAGTTGMQHMDTSSNRQHLEINTKASVLLMQKEKAKQHVNFLLFHHVFSSDLLHYLPVICRVSASTWVCNLS